jgi:undecaprenyl-diphosphatase
VAFDEKWASRSYAYVADHAGLEAGARFATALAGGVTIVAVTAAACIACLLERRTLLAVWLAVTVGGSALLNTAIKLSLERTRPSTAGALTSAHGFSYPSGHTQAATVAYSAIMLVVGWQLCRPGPRLRCASTMFVAAIIAGVGASRVLLGAHWPSDVLGGWLLGGAWVAAATMVLARRQMRRVRHGARCRPGARAPATTRPSSRRRRR